MITPKHDRPAILAADPKSLNELLDLFEAYASTVREQIFKGSDMLREEIGPGEHDALGIVFGVAVDAEDMAKRLCQIRSARNAGTDVTVLLTGYDARTAIHSLEAVGSILSEIDSTLSVVQNRLEVSEDCGSRAVMSLTQRALRSVIEQEAFRLHQLAVSIKEAGKYRQSDEEEAA